MAKTSTAKKTTSTARDTKPAVEFTPPPAVPAGYEVSGDGNIDAWAKLTDGLIIHGKFMFTKTIETTFGPAEIAVLELVEPCKSAIVEDGEEPEEVPAGTMLAVILRQSLLVIRDQSKGTLCWVHVDGLGQTKGGNTFWQCTVAFRAAKGQARPAPQNSHAYDDVPIR